MSVSVEQSSRDLGAEGHAVDVPKAPGHDVAIERVLARVRLRARLRIAWLRKLWKESAEGGCSGLDPHSEIHAYLNNRDDPAAEAAYLAEDLHVQAWKCEVEEIEQAMAEDDRSRLASLHNTFGLNGVESDLLQACLACAVDPNLARVYAYLQDNNGRGYVTGDLVARLFGHGRCLVLSPESPLRVWQLIHEKEVGRGVPNLFECDTGIRDWLLGVDDLDEWLVGVARLQMPQPPLSGWPLDQAVSFIARMTNEDVQRRVRVHIMGVPGSGRRTLAACIAARLNMCVLTLDADRIEDRDWQTVYIHAQRHAYLQRCTLAWCGESLQRRRWPEVVPAFPVQFAVCEDERIPPVSGVVDYTVAVPPLSTEERRALWKSMIPVSSTWPERALDELAKRQHITVGQIAGIADRATDSVEDAAGILRRSARHHLSSLAQLLECPFDWDDLIVPDWLKRNLEDFFFEARERGILWERPELRRLFPQGRGLIALLTGPPGVGKTMCAQIVAAKLGLDLFRINLALVVSKYVGETSRNMERILSRAARMNAVLLFDEADALFGKRTEINDAHDRFANTDTDYLLQAIENYPGVAILASNKKENIDSSFIRRLRYVLEFPRPDEGQRLLIWRRIVAELAGEDRLESLEADIGRLAAGLELTGAQIKLSVLSALFAARREDSSLGMGHLLHGVERELMKEGSGISRHIKNVLMGIEEL